MAVAKVYSLHRVTVTFNLDFYPPPTPQPSAIGGSMKALSLSSYIVSNLFKSLQTLLVVVPIFAFGAAKTEGQTSNELFETSMASIPSGPTSASQTARLLLNSNNPTGNTIGATNINISVTASFSNQQYTGVGTGPGNPVVMFGASIAGTGAGGPTSIPAFGPMSSIASGVNTQFSNTPSGSAQGIAVAVNHAFDILTSTRHWAEALPLPPATNSRVYMADLTLTFSSPVTNPRLQFVGMGGTNGSLGFSSEFDLVTPGLTLTRNQGNAAFVVTSTQVNNGSVTIAASCAVADAASCGTVTVNGSNITTITFQTFIRGDGGGAAWSPPTQHAGDRWMLGVSLPESYNVSGNVFNDIDGPGTINGTGVGQPSGVQLYATLVDPTDNTVLGSIPVNPDGTYTFNGVPGGGVNYRVEISSNQGTQLSVAPARVLPLGWSSVGENLGAGPGNDGMADRALNITVNSANVVQANFGISMIPTAANVSISGRVMTAAGRGLPRTTVILTDMDGNSRTAGTSMFGYFRFDDVEVGNTYILTAVSKGYVFEQQTISILDEISDLEFIALE